MKIKAWLKKAIFYVVLLFIMIVIFCLAMIITYALPNERIQAHIAE